MQWQRATTAGRQRGLQEDLPLLLLLLDESQWVGLIRDGRRDRMSLNCSPSFILQLRPRGEQEVGDDSDDSSLKIRWNGVH